MNTVGFQLVSFDCYGTLIDWESGILAAMRAALPGLKLSDEEILLAYAEIEPRLQAGAYKPYRVILREVLLEIAGRFGMRPVNSGALADSLPGWNPFPDTAPVLKHLQKKYKLAIVSNIDNDLFDGTARRLNVPFDYVITAEEAGAYKPNQRNFRMLLERTGLTSQQIIHVAESLFHDIAPAGALGFTTVWVNCSTGRGTRASKVVEAQPDLTVPDLNALADIICP